MFKSFMILGTIVTALGLSACSTADVQPEQLTARICNIVNNGDSSFTVDLTGDYAFPMTYRGNLPSKVQAGGVYHFDYKATNWDMGIADAFDMTNVKSSSEQDLPTCKK